MIEKIELRGPHLILADLGGDDRIAPGQFMQLLDDELRLDDIGFLHIAQRMLIFPILDLVQPGLTGGGCFLPIELVAPLEPGIDAGQGVLAIGHDRDIDLDVLADR